jgi:2-polyprenyl-6-methoxyphenol hydroxylase-like FAD-dependent oxidoreductase
VIVGGGPAGSSAARVLKRAGADVLVLDKEQFPRLKLCAGWITPEVVKDLEMDISTYPHRFLTFDRLHVHVKALYVKVPCVQHSVRRFEFDAWLLERSGAPVIQHTVRNVRQDGDDYIVDEAFRCRYLIGAGGTRCPVYRTLFREANPRAAELQTVTLEHEIPYDWKDGDCHLWFFDTGLPGYSLEAWRSGSSAAGRTFATTGRTSLACSTSLWPAARSTTRPGTAIFCVAMWMLRALAMPSSRVTLLGWQRAIWLRGSALLYAAASVLRRPFWKVGITSSRT